MTARKGIGSHQSSSMMKDEWLTPPEIIDALGWFDMDPCAPKNRPWDTAKAPAAIHLTIDDDGLKLPWAGRIWLNPPYGKHTGKWLNKLAEHGNGIALIFARTETDMFFEQVWNRATAILFIKGRLHFHHVTGERAKANSGAPSALIAYGEGNRFALHKSKIPGKLIHLKTPELR